MVVALMGIVGNAVVVAFFLGKLRERQSGQEQLVAAFQGFMNQTINALLSRLNSFDALASDSVADRASLNARMAAVEHNTQGMQGLRDSVTKLDATFSSHANRAEADMKKVSMGVESLQRQMANIASGRAGTVTTISSEHPNG